MENEKKSEFSVVLPFSGFYCSVHEQNLDWAFEQLLSDREGCGTSAPEKLCELASDSIRWREVHVNYAMAYAENLLSRYQLDGSFEELDSPRFYNYSTDRIFVKLSRASVAKMCKMTDKQRLTECAKSLFTSYDGFASFYSPDWRDWGSLSGWDHNQLHALLIAFIETKDQEEWDTEKELELMEYEQGNYGFESLLIDNAGPDFTRALDIWDYLQDRQDRGKAKRDTSGFVVD